MQSDPVTLMLIGLVLATFSAWLATRGVSGMSQFSALCALFAIGSGLWRGRDDLFALIQETSATALFIVGMFLTSAGFLELNRRWPSPVLHDETLYRASRKQAWLLLGGAVACFSGAFAVF